MLKTTIGKKYYYPSIKGAALIVTVLSTSVEHIIVKYKKQRFYIDRKDWDIRAAGLPGIKVVDINPDEENEMVFVRYTRNENIIDRIYNWWVGKRKAIEI